MVRKFGPLAVLGIVAAACTDATAPAEPARLAPLLTASGDLTTQLVPNEYIVVLDRNERDVPAASARSGATVIARWETALKGYAVRANAEQLRVIRTDARVAYVEANARATTLVTQTPVPAWGLDRIDQTGLPLSNSFTYGNTGVGVHAYIIDTGILGTHNEFTGRMGNGFTSVNDGNGTSDCNGHGTHVAGTVGGTQYGVAKGVTLHPVRVLDCGGSGSWAGVISGINWVAANRVLPAVANMSLGGGLNSAINTATANLVAAGVFTAVASGNSSANACSFSPASTPAAMTVNSSTSSDARSSFSNFGSCTDIFAPGSGIKSAYNQGNSSTATLSGTSMASPHVAGAGALYLAANPSHTPAQTDAALKQFAVTNAISNPGTGSPNRLLNISFIGGGTGNQAPQADFTISCTNATSPPKCTLDASSSTDDAGFGNLTMLWTNNVTRPTKTGNPVSYNYLNSSTRNTFDVTLKVTDAGGLSHSITKQIVIPPPGSTPGNQAPIADFTISCQTASTPHTCTLNASASSDDAGFGNLTFAWSTDVGRPAKTGSIATYQYVTWPYPNSFNVTLTATDAGGLTGTVTKAVVIP